MGKIEDSLFQERVILEKDFQTNLFKLYAKFSGGVGAAATKLELKMTTYSAYKRYQSKSIPTEIFDKIFNDTKYTWLEQVLQFNSKEEKIKARKTLSSIQSAFLKNFWDSDRKTAMDTARKASAQGLLAQRKLLGPNWKEEITKAARKALKDKYGEDAFKIIGAKGMAEARIKHGKNLSKVISAGTIKGLKKKYGDNYKQVLGDLFKDRLEDSLGPDWANVASKMGHDALRKKFGKNFAQVTLMRARLALTTKYGNDCMRKIGRGERTETVERRKEILNLIRSGEATTTNKIIASTDLDPNKVTRALTKLMRKEEVIREREGHMFVYRPTRVRNQ